MIPSCLTSSHLRLLVLPLEVLPQVLLRVEELQLLGAQLVEQLLEVGRIQWYQQLEGSLATLSEYLRDTMGGRLVQVLVSANSWTAIHGHVAYNRMAEWREPRASRSARMRPISSTEPWRSPGDMPAVGSSRVTTGEPPERAMPMESFLFMPPLRAFEGALRFGVRPVAVSSMSTSAFTRCWGTHLRQQKSSRCSCTVKFS